MKKENFSRPHPFGLRLHHLKVALRNLWKFRVQTVVCVLGLSVGMACFALGTLWLRHIESFEDFVPEIENVYAVTRGKSEFSNSYEYSTKIGEGKLLEDSIPAVTSSAFFLNYVYGKQFDAKTEDGRIVALEAEIAHADSGFFEIFGIKALEGNVGNLGKNGIALTKSLANKIFGDISDVVGKSLEISPKEKVVKQYISIEDHQYTVAAVIPDCPQNTQFHYEAIIFISDPAQFEKYSGRNFVKLNPKADLTEIVEKNLMINLESPSIVETSDGQIVERKTIKSHKFFIVPLARLRAEFPPSEVLISTNYVRWFMMLGALVILCALCNYIITMVNHLRRRAWEMSLRRVLGAKVRVIIEMVSVETILLFLISALLSSLLTAAVLPYFREYSSIELPLSAISSRLGGYLALIIVVGCALSAFVAWIVMRKTQQNILGARQLKHSSTSLDHFGVILQLALSMGIIFSASVMFRQINYLMHTEDVGFAHTDMGYLAYVTEDVRQKIHQSPMIVDFLDDHNRLFPRDRVSKLMWEKHEEGKDVEIIKAESLDIDSAFVSFYQMKLVAGNFPSELEINDRRVECCINETMCREQGWTPQSAIGQEIVGYKVAGVFNDTYILGPLVPPTATLYLVDLEKRYAGLSDSKIPSIAFRTKPGKLQEMCDSIDAWYAASPESLARVKVQNTEQEYNKCIASEQMLSKILWAVALCSLFVCVLGAFSLVSLSLTERRKEIAIRKAHGAHISDILQLFLRSHYLSLGIAALIAYPLSYLIMRNWLEHYTKQVGISWWLIPATFLLISFVVIATISAKIYFAAKEKAARALAG